MCGELSRRTKAFQTDLSQSNRSSLVRTTQIITLDFSGFFKIYIFLQQLFDTN